MPTCRPPSIFLFSFLFFITLIISIPSGLSAPRSNDFHSFNRITEFDINDEVSDFRIDNNNEIIVLTDARNFEVWQFNDNSYKNIITSEIDNEMSTISISPSGRWVYNGKYIYSTTDWSKIFTIQGFYGEWSPDEEHFLVFCSGNLVLWNTTDWSVEYSWKDIGMFNKIWTDNIHCLITGNGINEIDIVNKTVSVIFKGEDIAEPNSVGCEISVEPGGNSIAIADATSNAKIYNLTTREFERYLYGHPQKVIDADYSPLNDSVVSAGNDGSIRVWWKPDFVEKEVTVLTSSSGLLYSKWSPNGLYLVAGSSDGHYTIWKRSIPPLDARCGVDKIVPNGYTLNLDGSASQGNILPDGYTWNISSGNESIATLQGRTAPWTFGKIGQFNITLNVTDGFNFDEDTMRVTVIEDNEKPVVEITYPEDGTNITGYIKIIGTASDNSQVTAVNIRINNDEWMTCEGTTSWLYLFNSKDFINGRYTISVKAYDGLEYSDIAEITLNFSNIHPGSGNLPPTIMITTPHEGDEIKGVIWIRGISDDDSMINSVQIVPYYRDNGGSLSVFGTTTWCAQWDTMKVTDGWWVINATAIDDKSKVTSVLLNVYVNNSGKSYDWLPPVLTITYPIEGSKLEGLVQVTGTSSDNVNVFVVQVSFNNRTWYDSIYTDPFSVGFDTLKRENGNYLIIARAYDGYQFSYDTVNVTIDNKNENSEVTGSDLASPIWPVIAFLYLSAAILFLSGTVRIKVLGFRPSKFVILTQALGFVLGLLLSSVILLNYYHAPSSGPVDSELPIDGIDEENRAQDFTMVSTDGKLITNDNQMGSIVVIQFFNAQPQWGYNDAASSIKNLTPIHAEFKDEQVTFISLEGCGLINENDFRNVFIENGGSWSYNYDLDNRIAINIGGGTTSGSTIVIIDRQGHKIYSGALENNEDEITEKITEALGG